MGTVSSCQGQRLHKTCTAPAGRLCEAGLALLHGPGGDADRGWALTVLDAR